MISARYNSGCHAGSPLSGERGPARYSHVGRVPGSQTFRQSRRTSLHQHSCGYLVSMRGAPDRRWRGACEYTVSLGCCRYRDARTNQTAGLGSRSDSTGEIAGLRSEASWLEGYGPPCLAHITLFNQNDLGGLVGRTGKGKNEEAHIYTHNHRLHHASSRADARLM